MLPLLGDAWFDHFCLSEYGFIEAESDQISSWEPPLMLPLLGDAWFDHFCLNEYGLIEAESEQISSWEPPLMLPLLGDAWFDHFCLNKHGSRSTMCYLLDTFHAAACCCMLLHAAACCCMRLHAATCCYILLLKFSFKETLTVTWFGPFSAVWAATMPSKGSFCAKSDALLIHYVKTTLGATFHEKQEVQNFRAAGMRTQECTEYQRIYRVNHYKNKW